MCRSFLRCWIITGTCVCHSQLDAKCCRKRGRPTRYVGHRLRLIVAAAQFRLKHVRLILQQMFTQIKVLLFLCFHLHKNEVQKQVFIKNKRAVTF